MHKNTKSIYLSLDLDVFNTTKDVSIFDDIMQHVIQHKDVKVCMSHEKILGHVNTSKSRELWNVDFHTDLYQEDEDTYLEGLNCGNWCNYVKWRKNNMLVWVNPHSSKGAMTKYGRCDNLHSVPLSNSKVFGWHVITRKLSKLVIPWTRVERIGVAVSPNYTDPQILRELVLKGSLDVRRWFSKQKIYIRAHEWMGLNG